MIHFFKKPVSHLALPEKFTYPFHYTPHPLCVLAAEEVKAYIASRKEWQEELVSGKMFGVLIVQTDNGITNNEENQIGYLAAFSGNLDGKNLHPYFVPPVYDLLQPEGFFKIEEEQISAINIRIRELENSSSYLNSKEKWKIETEQAKAVLNQAKAELKIAKEAREIRRQSSPELSEEEQASLIRESQYQKAEYKRLEKEWNKRLEELETEVRYFDIEIERLKTERKERSAALQRKLFEQFRMLNAQGEVKDLYTIFEQTVQKVPPAGAGECALPKLLQYAYLHQSGPCARRPAGSRCGQSRTRYHGSRGQCAHRAELLHRARALRPLDDDGAMSSSRSTPTPAAAAAARRTRSASAHGVTVSRP